MLVGLGEAAQVKDDHVGAVREQWGHLAIRRVGFAMLSRIDSCGSTSQVVTILRTRTSANPAVKQWLGRL